MTADAHFRWPFEVTFRGHLKGRAALSGAGSGGGSVTVMFGSDASSITPAANGGQGRAANYSVLAVMAAMARRAS